MVGTSGNDSSPLVGRHREQTLLSSLLDQVAAHGRALVIRGEPGIGKSRLLAEASRGARDRGLSVLTTTGVESEAHLPFAGLHQLLRPVRARVAELPAAQRAVLDAAFGLTDDAAPEYYRIAMAALDLLSDIAADAPVLLVIEDAQWLDGPTSEVLAFIARRIESDPIIALVGVRDGYPSPLAAARLPEHRLTGLDDATSGDLLDAVAPSLPLATRTRILREAAGNPLALLELPAAAGALGDGQWVSGGLPLTERLEQAFAARVSDLPEATRLVLLVAALNDGDSVEEILRAAGAVAGTDLELEVAAPATEVGILDPDAKWLRFRHPLIRSAIAQSAGVGARRRVHEALASVLGDRDRRAWHRAALLSGEHEDVALELEAAGTRAQHRGALAVAVTAMRRAAELGDPASRSRRLLGAAALAVELGRPDAVEPLLAEVNQLALGALDRARVTWVEEIAVTRPIGHAERIGSLVAAAEHAGAEGDRELQVDLLWLVASRAWWVDPGAAARALLIDAAHRLGDVDADDPRVFAIHAYADPLGHAAGVLARLRREAGREDLDSNAARFFGPAALVVGAFDLGNDFLAAAVDGLRTEGRLGHLPRLLTLYSSMAARLGDWELAISAAEEARRLAEEFAEPQWQAAADTVISLVAAMRGDEEKAESLAAQAEMVAEPAGANITMAFAQFGKVLAALGSGRHSDAFAHAERVFDPGDSAYHPVISSWLIADLAEAARPLGRLQAARSRVAQVEAITSATGETWITLVLRHAQALVADGPKAGERFQEALAGDLTRWPFQRARIQLAYGQWLRRQRRVAESRGVLRTARETFDALGCAPWGDQARRELRASGERSRRRLPEARDQLTAQELQIAQLAAEGLSNREIGQRLYLSHRTISTHLYRVFPKLGITSRVELSRALAPRPLGAGAGGEVRSSAAAESR